MIPSERQRFNANFSEATHQKLLADLAAELGEPTEFRVSETPIFLPAALFDEMEAAAITLLTQLDTPEYRAASTRAIPERFFTPNEGERPLFAQVDFAITRGEGGALSPKLVELQAWASLYAFQFVLPRFFKRHYELGALPYLPRGLSDEAYLSLIRAAIVRGHDPENVVLMEIEPHRQKTRPDFVLTERLLGVPTVGISEVLKRGDRLFYRKGGREIPIKRIYNRVIAEEFIGRNVECAFDFREPLEVEWAGHPNWFFRVSKFSLPFLRHPAVPRAWFLSDLKEPPPQLENFVLKPLFSFAGSGVKVNVFPEDIAKIPEPERQNYLLQEKISYAPLIPTPDEPSKLEVRLMVLWPEGEAKPRVVNTLPRMSKGVMLGVDFNKNKTWVGSSCCFLES